MALIKCPECGHRGGITVSFFYAQNFCEFFVKNVETKL